MIHIYCGDGKGKTTASCGLALRAAGSGMKVLFTSFFKNGDSSEVSMLSSVGNITYVMQEKSFGRYKTLNDKQKADACVYYDSLLRQVIEKSGDYDVVVLDEAISAYNYDVISRSRLVDFLYESSSGQEIILTGRNPSDELIRFADYVTEMKKVKHPYDKGIIGRKGIEF